MTLVRDAWIGGRPVAVLRDEEGREAKFVCLRCEAELEADRAVFEHHNCENYREGPEATIAATPAAREHADETGVDLARVEGTGADGQIIKADVQAAQEEE